MIRNVNGASTVMKIVDNGKCDELNHPHSQQKRLCIFTINSITLNAPIYLNFKEHQAHQSQNLADLDYPHSKNPHEY